MKTRKVALPSGFEVTIREPGCLDILRCGVAMPALNKNSGDGEEFQPADDPEAADRALLATAAFACRLSVEPRFAIEPTDEETRAGVRSLNDLSLHDYVALLAAIRDLREISEERLRPLATAPSS